MPGFDTGSVMYALNVDFTGNSLTGGTAQITTNGQLLIGSTSAPQIKVGALTSPGNTVTIGYSSPNITLDVNGGGFTWHTISGAGFNAVANNGYFIGAGQPTSITMPASIGTTGGTFIFITKSADVLTINANTNWFISFGNVTTASGGTATSSAAGDSVILTSDGNNTWFATGGFTGNWTLT